MTKKPLILYPYSFLTAKHLVIELEKLRRVNQKYDRCVRRSNSLDNEYFEDGVIEAYFQAQKSKFDKLMEVAANKRHQGSSRMIPGQIESARESDSYSRNFGKSLEKTAATVSNNYNPPKDKQVYFKPFYLLTLQALP